MEWWQVVLILLAITVLGVCVGILSYYLYLRFILKRDASLLSTLTLLFAPKKLKRDRVREEQQNFIAPDLLSEIEYNLKIASQPLRETLLPLERRVWDGQQHEVNNLPANLRDELQQVYNDIDSVNTLVWFSTKFRRRSPDLNKTYMTICSIIVQRLNTVEKLIRLRKTE